MSWSSKNIMVIQSSAVVWVMSIIALSIGGTFVIIYIIKHVMDYFERRKNREKKNRFFIIVTIIK